MNSLLDRWRSRICGWEVYTHQFIAYIFHFEEGRRVRGRFVRQVLLRTFLYMTFVIPVFILLGFLRWLPHTAEEFAILIICVFDVALGIAFLRIVSQYRARVELIYRLNTPGFKEQADDLPVALRPKTSAQKLLHNADVMFQPENLREPDSHVDHLDPIDPP